MPPEYFACPFNTSRDSGREGGENEGGRNEGKAALQPIPGQVR